MPAWRVTELKDKTVDHEKTFLFPIEGPVFQFKFNPTSLILFSLKTKQTNYGSQTNELIVGKGKNSLQFCLCVKVTH